MERFLASVFIVKENSFVYVFSLSEIEDDLSQWRGYCPGGNGFCLSFCASDLVEQMSKHGFHLKKCIYKKSEQENLVKDIICKNIDELETNFKPAKTINDYFKIEHNVKLFIKSIDEATVKFLLLAPQLKDESFEDEREWRLISGIYIRDDKNINLRSGKSMIIPYKAFGLWENELFMPIDKIKVGPNPHMKLSVQSVEMLLNKKDMKMCHVEPSKIPYRVL